MGRSVAHGVPLPGVREGATNYVRPWDVLLSEGGLKWWFCGDHILRQGSVGLHLLHGHLRLHNVYDFRHLYRSLHQFFYATMSLRGAGPFPVGDFYRVDD